MTKKFEALMLADAIEDGSDICDQAADELRRLHEVNAELLAALRWIAETDFNNADDAVIAMMAWVMRSKAQVALNKTTGETE